MVLLLPLTAVALITYCGSGIYLLGALRHWKKEYMEIFIFGAFVYYYLFLPGAITAPRYQIPALPCLCVYCALMLICCGEKILRKTEKNENSGVVEVEESSCR